MFKEMFTEKLEQSLTKFKDPKIAEQYKKILQAIHDQDKTTAEELMKTYYGNHKEYLHELIWDL